MYDIKNWRLWLKFGIGIFLLSILSFIRKSYIVSFGGFLLSVSFLVGALMLANINDSTKNAITKFVTYFFNPLLVTFIGTFCYIGIQDAFYKNMDINVILFSINFFIIIFILNIFFKKNNIFYKKH